MGALASSGSVKIVRPLRLDGRVGRIEITNARGKTAGYDTAALLSVDGTVIGYALVKDDDEMYHIDASRPWGWTCDCGDCHFRRRECKHILALRAAYQRQKKNEKSA